MKNNLPGLIPILFTVLLFSAVVFSQTTEFTFQGSLQNSSAPASGNFDFEFLLYDTVTGGTQIGATLTRSTVAVSAGAFAVKLDFGANFPGANRFLEIHVRTAGGGAFTSLAPRQLINSAPYSVKAVNADNATNATTATNATQLGGVAANQFVLTGDARLSDARPPAAGSTSYIQNGTGVQATSNFNISGDGTAGGTLSSNIVNATTQYNLGGSRILSNAGTNNLFAGANSGSLNTGTYNTFFGPAAGQANTTGTSNSFFGSAAGQANTTGYDNSFVGMLSGTSNTTGFFNAFFGAYAGRRNSTGNTNSFFGQYTGEANTTGFQNSFFGHNAGEYNTTGDSNTFLGTAAGVNNISGARNTFVGMFTGTTNTTGLNNSSLGLLADVGANNLTNATAIGSFSYVTQSNSIVLGGINGINGATADTNVGIGTSSPSSRLHVVGNGLFNGDLTVTGTTSSNVVNSTAQYNLAGSRILSNAGSNNLFAGVGSGASNTTGTFNSFVGTAAGAVNTTGSQNAIFGPSAGQGNTLGSSNSFFGMFSGVGNTTGDNNSFFGISAGVTNTTGSNNTALGYIANVGSNNLTNATAIGSRSAVTQSNSVVLGSINGVNGATADTNVGIGTTAPTSRLHVVGNGLFTGNLTVNGTLNATLPTGSASYVQNGTGQQAASNFNISGDGTAGGTLSSNIVNATTQYNLGGDRILSSNTALNNLFVGSGAGAVNTGNLNSFFGQGAGQANTTGQFNTFVGAYAGNLNTTGIWNTFFGEGSGSQNTTGYENAFFGLSAGKNGTTSVANSYFGNFAGQNTTTGANNAFFGHSAGLANTTGGRNTIIGSGANVVSGNLTNATAIGYQAKVSQSNSLVLGSIFDSFSGTADTNVGIGTTAPSKRFVVGGGTGASGVFNNGIFVNIPGGAAITARDSTGGVEVQINAESNGLGTVGTFTNHPLNFRTNNSEAVRIDTAGNVGIGTNNPNDKLDVNGIIRVVGLGSAGSTALCRNASNQISTCSSSARYKNNINSFTSGLDLIKKLRPVSFNWRDGGMADMGLVAEEVNKVEPLLTTTNSSGQVEGVKYDRVGVVLVNAVKEQQAQIEELKKQNQAQQNQIELLMKIVCSQKKNAEVCKRAAASK